MLTTHLKKTAALKDRVDRYHGGPQEQRVCSLNDRCEGFHADAAAKPKAGPPPQNEAFVRGTHQKFNKKEAFRFYV